MRRTVIRVGLMFFCICFELVAKQTFNPLGRAHCRRFPLGHPAVAGACLLPFGILEKHGPQLPLGTDLLNVRYAALHAADQDMLSFFLNIILARYSKLVTNLAPSPIADKYSSTCFRRPPTRWLGTAARKSSSEWSWWKREPAALFCTDTVGKSLMTTSFTSSD